MNEYYILSRSETMQITRDCQDAAIALLELWNDELDGGLVDTAPSIKEMECDAFSHLFVGTMPMSVLAMAAIGCQLAGRHLKLPAEGGDALTRLSFELLRRLSQDAPNLTGVVICNYAMKFRRSLSFDVDKPVEYQPHEIFSPGLDPDF